MAILQHLKKQLLFNFFYAATDDSQLSDLLQQHMIIHKQSFCCVLHKQLGKKLGEVVSKLQNLLLANHAQATTTAWQSAVFPWLVRAFAGCP